MSVSVSVNLEELECVCLCSCMSAGLCFFCVCGGEGKTGSAAGELLFLSLFLKENLEIKKCVFSVFLCLFLYV